MTGSTAVGVPAERFPGERRVALVPAGVEKLASAGFRVVVESGAGTEAGFPDDAYASKGAEVAGRRAVLGSGVILGVRTFGADPGRYEEDLAQLSPGTVVVGMGNPIGAPEPYRRAAEAGVTAFALELLPRIARAQSMDVLSSQATVAGYRAVLLAASALPKMFPLLTTAAGTLTPARVLVVGAGVAGLQAIATARRLGAVVEAYDVRPAVKEQVESLGARFVELELETGGAEDRGGYATEQSEEFLARQRELMARVVAASDVVITTALVPGKRAPVLVTSDMVEGMAPGSVVVDAAADAGGNCEATRPGETVVEHGVTVIGELNLPSAIPSHASQMYSRNVVTFLQHLAPDGEISIDLDDEITRETLVVRDGEIVNPRVREALGAESPAEAG